MALAPADFYAYSQATGTPLPESPQERANLAPEVLNFRRNQLKAPQAEQGGPDPLSLGIGIGLGLAGVGGVAYGAKRLLGGRQRIPKAPTTSANAGTVVQDFDKAGLEKIVNKNVSEAVAEQKRRSAVYQNVAAKPEQDLKPVYKPSADAPVDLITDPNTGEIFARGRSPKSFNELYASLQTEQTPVESKPSPVNTDIYYEESKPAKSFAEEYISSSPEILSQLRARAAEKIRLQDPVLGDPEWKVLINRQTLQEKGELGREAQRQMRVAKQLENEANEFLQQLKQESLSSQAIAAVESGEDQMTGRVMRSVQRNEDLDVSQVNATARQTGSADVAAAATPDGIPFDQTENFQIIGRFPGPEGSSSFGVEFTPVESRYQGRPFRYTKLPAGSSIEGVDRPSALLTEGTSKYAAYGLSAPKTHVIPDDVALNIQNSIKKQGNKLETYQRQALDLFETTGDYRYLESAFGPAPAMAYQGRLPGGETVQTKDLFIPIGERINPRTGEAIIDTRLEALSRAEGPQGIRSRVREQTLQQIERMTGIRPVIPSAKQMADLPAANKRAQALANRDIKEAQARYQQAQDFAVNYALSPEAKRGVYTGPQFETNPLTGKQVFVGMSPQVEQETIATPSLYQMRSSAGTSRSDLGGVGRRREALESEGFSSFQDDPVAFLYKDVDTGELVEPGSVLRQDLESGKYVPVRGTSVEPQRILGTEGRTFKGISSAEIDPRSFDPATRQALAQQFPERVTPEGLIYSEKALERPSEARQYGRKFATQAPTIYNKEALNVSLEYDRLRRSGVPGAAEAFLDKIKKEREVSELGASQPLRQKLNRQGRFSS